MRMLRGSCEETAPVEISLNRATLTFDVVLTSESIHAERLPCTVCLQRLVLIAQAVFSLHRGQTNRRTQSHRRN